MNQMIICYVDVHGPTLDGSPLGPYAILVPDKMVPVQPHMTTQATRGFSASRLVFDGSKCVGFTPVD